MTLTAFDLPEDFSEAAQWLESMVCGGDLRSFVSQRLAIPVRAAAENLDSMTKIDQILGDHRQAVLRDGLSTLPSTSLGSLLSNPTSLLDLQEMTMIHGSDHWQRQYAASDDAQANAAMRERVLEMLPPSPMKAIQLKETESLHQDAKKPSLSFWISIAAALLLVVGGTGYFLNQSRDADQVASGPVEGIGWGWASEGGVPNDLSGPEYLQTLAKGAEAWGKKPVPDKRALQKRLTEFRAGCNRLATMPHRTIAPEDERWLKNNCLDWRDSLDSILASLDSQEFAKSKAQADLLASEMELALLRRSQVQPT